MDSNRWQQIEALMEEVAHLPAPQRASFLHNSCHGDHALEEEVWSLLVARQKSERFPEDPAIAVAARATSTRLPGVSIPAEFVAGEAVSHYVIVEKIGSGGMGVVYKAEDEGLRISGTFPKIHPRTVEISVDSHKIRDYA